MKPLFRMDGRPLLVLVAGAGAFVLGALLILLAALVPTLLSRLAVVLLVLALAAIAGFEYLLWARRGIRSVEIDGDTLTLYRGASLRIEKISRASGPAVRTTRRFGRRVVLVRPGRAGLGRVRAGRLRTGRVPPGGAGSGKIRPVRIPEDAFPREEFSRFLALLERWRQG